MKALVISAIGLSLLLASAPAYAVDTVITFDDIPEGTVATNQYNGLTITGGSVLTQGSVLNPTFPPLSPPNVLYNYADGTILLNFTNAVTGVGGYITGNELITLSVFDGATLLGTTSTAGANYVGSGGTPNEFLQLLFGNITSATFTGTTSNTFTLDNLTVGGIITTNGAVPEPATWAMMLLGFGGIGVAMRRRRRIGALIQQMG